MRGTLKIFLLLGAVLLLAAWIVSKGGNVQLPAWMGEALRHARGFYAAYPSGTIAIFCLAHFLSSTLALPGGCTALNVGSGALFGFWLGCAVVYPVTLLSACVGYLAASGLRQLRILARHEPVLGVLRKRLGEGGFLFLVTLRLSPFFPFGVLNPLLGLLRVPFGAFVASTFVGVFLDVFLLNSIGAALAVAGEEAYDAKAMLLAFCGLLGAVMMLHHLAGNLKPMETAERAQ